MAKTKETLAIEDSLANLCHEKGIYGCEEVTIGFPHQKKGNEIVDFITMDSKGTIRCYEIKVTLQDLKSNAKKSWHGHYNYLVVSESLHDKVSNWDEYLLDNVGLIVHHKTGYVGRNGFFAGSTLETVFSAKKNDVSDEMLHILKESMIRSMYYKKEKYKDANNLEKQKELQKECRELKKKYEKEQKENERQYTLIRRFLWLYWRLTGDKVYFEDIIERMEKEYEDVPEILTNRKKRKRIHKT